jgi:hypothetical protein
MEDTEHFIRYVAFRLYEGDAPMKVLDLLVNLGMTKSTAFLVYSAGKILYENS